MSAQPSNLFVLVQPCEEPRKRLPFRALQPVPFGTPDPRLARALVTLIREATPPTLIPAHPLTEGRLRAFLRHLHL